MADLPDFLQPKLTDEFFKDIAERVGLPFETLSRLYAVDDDWSLVVRATALVEATLNECLENIEILGGGAEWLVKRSLHDKTSFLGSVGLLPDNLGRAIRVLLRIRNAAVHDLRAFDFDLVKFLEAQQDVAQLRKDLAREGEVLGTSIATATNDPRWAVWSAAIAVINILLPPTWMTRLYKAGEKI